MAKKGIFKKILKGVGIGLVSVAGGLLGFSAIKGVAKGTGALIGLKNGLNSIKGAGDKVAQSGLKLLTGKTKEERQLVNAQKDETKADLHKLQLVQDLIRAGATPEEARAKVGLDPEELPTLTNETGAEKIPVTLTGSLMNPKNLMLAGGALLVLILLFKKK